MLILILILPAWLLIAALGFRSDGDVSTCWILTGIAFEFALNACCWWAIAKRLERMDKERNR